jgi:chromate transporter
MQTYLELFLAFFKIGIFGFGGGYAMLPLIKNEVVDLPHQWLSFAEFTDIVAISQMTPGPIAINSATYVGYSVSGNIYGALIATLGVCLPPFFIMLLISRFYLKFRQNRTMENVFLSLKPAIIGLIGAAALSLMNRQNFVDYSSVILFCASFYASYRKTDPFRLIIVAGIAGMLLYSH